MLLISHCNIELGEGELNALLGKLVVDTLLDVELQAPVVAILAPYASREDNSAICQLGEESASGRS